MKTLTMLAVALCMASDLQADSGAPLLSIGQQAGGQRGQSGRGDRGRPDAEKDVFKSVIPDYAGNVIIGRPAAHSITLSIMTKDAVKATVVYGLSGKFMNLKTGPFDMKAGLPGEISLDGLTADSAYEYRVMNYESGKPLLSVGGNGSFTTCRSPGASFTFTVQADSHLDGNSDSDLYRSCLISVLAGKPDFHIDLGDTFMTGKIATREEAVKQYLAQRYYFGLIGHVAPVFLVVGNHDGEEAVKPGAAGSAGLAAWSCIQRKRFFPNPVPDKFYTGNVENRADAGLIQDYYAWTWGDALFVVLDPYWTSRQTRGGTEPWNMTLGRAQYDWLARTLRGSTAKFKFVFIHQLVGGLDKGGRGGAEAAILYEWGGREKDCKDTFAVNRPGWGMPIHKLLVETGVSAVFHGHDHFYAHQELDGIVYQLVP